MLGSGIIAQKDMLCHGEAAYAEQNQEREEQVTSSSSSVGKLQFKSLCVL
jgi:hypothetical protein